MTRSGVFILCCFAPVWLLLAKLQNAPLPWAVVALAICVSAVLIWLRRQTTDVPAVQSLAERKRIGRVFIWSSMGEGVGILIAINVLNAMHMEDRVLPGIALIVGLHFIPIGLKVPMVVAFFLAASLCVSSLAGFFIPAVEYAALFVGWAGALILWAAVGHAIYSSRARA